MKYIALLLIGFIGTLVCLDLWAGTLTPVIEPKERFVMDDTFYEQNSQLNAVLGRIQTGPAVKTIALGDSTLYGALVHDNETIPYELGKLAQNSTYPDSKVYNLAYPGARPADIYAMLKLVTPLHPDLVIIDVNVVFFAQGILNEGALANQRRQEQFLFEKDVPPGIFKENRVEAAVKTWVRDTNIGQNKTAINTALFKQAPRGYIRDWLAQLLPSVTAAPKPPVEAPRDVIGMGWKDKAWGPKEQKTMARIYDQGNLDETNNDSVRMLHRIIDYAKDHAIHVLYYLAPQNETLIGRFFSLDQLHRNEQYLRTILQDNKAWFIDLSQAIPEGQFGDYDHMLREGHVQVAAALQSAIAAREAAAK
jgi:hypothetical protein